MRGADEAVRDLVERVLTRLLPCSKFAWTLPRNVTEDAAERAKAVPAGLKRNFDNRQIGIPKQRFCAFDPARQQIAVRRDPERFLERPREMRLGYPAYSRKALDRPFLVASSVHAVLGTKQPAQEERFHEGEAYRVSFR